MNTPRMPARPRFVRRVSGSAEVRAALDAFRHIVQALRIDRAGKTGAGLSSAQLFALQQIAEHPDASINDIAALTFTHQSSVSVVVQRLARLRLVAKIAARDDRRRQCLALTAKGRKVLHRAPVAVQEHLISAISALPAADRRAFARSLRAIAQSVVPDGVESHPPMFFESRPSGTGRERAKKADGSPQRKAHGP